MDLELIPDDDHQPVVQYPWARLSENEKMERLAAVVEEQNLQLEELRACLKALLMRQGVVKSIPEAFFNRLFVEDPLGRK